MSDQFPVSDAEIIDVAPARRRRWRRWLLGAAVLLFILLSRSLSIYVSALWFGSMGYSPVYWYILKFKVVLFLIFLLLTAVILRTGFFLLERIFAVHALAPRTVIVNNQPVQFAPARFLRPVSWGIALIFALFAGFSMKGKWLEFAAYLNRTQTSLSDPIFQKPLEFYLFSLPVLDAISSWLVTLTFVLFCAALIYSLLSLPQTMLKNVRSLSTATSFAATSGALAAFLLAFAWRVYLSRFPYLWSDHQTFTGVTYTEAHYLLPALTLVALALVVAALIALLNAFTKRGLRLLLLAVAIPALVYIVGVVIIPAYVNSFIVKPNELGRETPYIEHNITWTRRAFGIDKIEQRNFEAETSVEAFALPDNRATLENIRLWDWRALQDTLKQMQAIRIYYDFPDVDVDRYQTGGQTRQMMIAARELNIDKLPETSRNWVNQRLIYTHGYGVTMNTANEFTPEGRPRFVLSDMPIESISPDIPVKRPQIYFGQETNSNVYVKTKQHEFDFPQGETDTYTSYDGSGGIRIGSGLRRFLISWALGDLTKVPFSDAITSESRVLINRNIREIVNGLAPFLIYDRDPYIVTGSDGNLYWIIDAFTETSNYPYSRHHNFVEDNVNYVRNSVKVVIDAYHGTTNFYVFDPEDPVIAAYRATFPGLFRDASQMPADLRAH
ncbi:MAG TPA: UPF0182 family protein, partial [Pyrinomonadaceae bacterium]|nr:UPF0182 family protein [Pyrinomonadaceae bacterium]